MAELVVGADGGNSKTDLVLADTDGRILARVRGDGTRGHAEGMDATMGNVAALVEQARAEALIPAGTPISTAVYFLANVDTPADEEEAARFMTAHGLSGGVVVHNDTFAVLHAGAPEGWGVAVVCGAGINATGVDRHGRVARFLALGAISGDWGGGIGVGVAALGHAVRAGDGRGPATVLRETIVAPFAVRTPEELALAIEGKQIAQASLRLLAPVVFAAAEDGDNVAVGIVHQLADEIVIMVQALMNRLDLTEDATPVVLGGGTLQFGPPVLLNRITDSIRAIAPKAEPRLLDVSPVAGAVLHAMSSAGAGEAAMRKAREGLKDESFSTLTTSG